MEKEKKRSAKNCDCEKNEIAKHCYKKYHSFSWDQKKVKDIHSLNNPNHINKSFYMLPEKWLPNLR